MKRAGETGALEGSVQPVGFLKGLGIDRDDGVEARAFLVKGLDTVQIELDKLARGEPPGFVGIMNILYGRLGKTEGLGLAMAFAGEKRDETEQGDRP